MDHQKQGEVICLESKTHTVVVTNPDDSSVCPYDFAVLHSETDKSLGEEFFKILEEKYQLKGFHSKRDCVVGVFKQRHQIAAWKKSRFIVELISIQSIDDKSFQRWRSIAHEVECQKAKNSNPELLPIFLDIPREEQRQFTTTVGRSYSDTQEFWDELISYMQGIPSSLSGSSPRSSQSSETDLERETSLDESAAVKYRRKHKVFHGLFSRSKKKKKQASTRAQKRVRKSTKKNKRKQKSKKKFGLRKLLCVPVKSDISGPDSYSYGPPVPEPPKNTETSLSRDTHSTARQDSVEGEHLQSSSRKDISRA